MSRFRRKLVFHVCRPAAGAWIHFNSPKNSRHLFYSRTEYEIRWSWQKGALGNQATLFLTPLTWRTVLSFKSINGNWSDSRIQNINYWRFIGTKSWAERNRILINMRSHFFCNCVINIEIGIAADLPNWSRIANENKWNNLIHK